MILKILSQTPGVKDSQGAPCSYWVLSLNVWWINSKCGTRMFLVMFTVTTRFSLVLFLFF